MKKSVALFAGLTALMLAGCATRPPLTNDQVAEAQRPIVCVGKEQCDRFWAKAQIWLSQHSEYRIQSATDTVISTYAPTNQEAKLSFVVLKEPTSNGANIRLQVSCGNLIGCPSMSPMEALLSFRRYVAEPS